MKLPSCDFTYNFLVHLFQLFLCISIFIFTIVGRTLLDSNKRLCDSVHLWEYALISFIINIIVIISYISFRSYHYYNSGETVPKILLTRNIYCAAFIIAINIAFMIWGIYELSASSCYYKTDLYDMCCFELCIQIFSVIFLTCSLGNSIQKECDEQIIQMRTEHAERKKTKINEKNKNEENVPYYNTHHSRHHNAHKANCDNAHTFSNNTFRNVSHSNPCKNTSRIIKYSAPEDNQSYVPHVPHYKHQKYKKHNTVTPLPLTLEDV